MCQQWIEKEVSSKQLEWIAFDLEARVTPGVKRRPDLIQLSTPTACLVVHVSGTTSKAFPALSSLLFGREVNKVGKDLHFDGEMLERWNPTFRSLDFHNFRELTENTAFTIQSPLRALGRHYLKCEFAKDAEWTRADFQWPLDAKLVAYAASDATFAADVFVAIQTNCPNGKVAAAVESRDGSAEKGESRSVEENGIEQRATKRRKELT